MRKKKIVILCMAFVMGANILGGCGNTTNSKQSAEPSVTGVVSETITPTTEAIPSPEATTPSEETSPSPEVSPTPSADEENQEFTFANIANLTFDFSSGVGGWASKLTINEDGTFEGQYHDSDMGDIGEGYPDGIMYSSTFNGKLSNPVKVNDYTYKVQLEQLKTTNPDVKEEIIDGIKYIYSDPYGLDDAKDILIYLPGAPIKELPEAFLDWVAMKGAINKESDKKFPYYGLYNVVGEQGWNSYEVFNGSVIEQELKEIEKQSADIDKKLEDDSLTQQEMNRLSGEQYKLWDDELNVIWRKLNDILPSDEMDRIRKEERQWVKRKEKEVKKAGDENGGGSLAPLLENTKAMEMTKERVYELAEIIRSCE